MPADEKKYHHGKLKEEILAAAMDKVEKSGLEKLSLREIARELGVSKNAPYRHYKSRECLLADLSRRALGLLYKEVDRELEEHPERERMKSIGKGYVLFGLRHPQLYRLIFNGNVLQSQGKDWFFQDKTYKLLSSMNGVSSNAKEADISSFSAWAYVHGIVLFIIDGIVDLSDYYSTEEEMEALIEKFFVYQK